MGASINNWITSSNKQPLSTLDKIKELLKIHYKLVLVQVHELQRLRGDKNKSHHVTYIDELYDHYIINNGAKTYTLA